MQATPRDARIDVEDVYHVVATIGPSAAPCIATKDRTSGKGLPMSTRRRHRMHFARLQDRHSGARIVFRARMNPPRCRI